MQNSALWYTASSFVSKNCFNKWCLNKFVYLLRMFYIYEVNFPLQISYWLLLSLMQKSCTQLHPPSIHTPISRPFFQDYPGEPVPGTRKAIPIWVLLKQETVSGSGINWAICKSAPRSRQITMPAPHHSGFYSPDALPAAQPTASKHWRHPVSCAHQTLRLFSSGHLAVIPIVVASGFIVVV